MQFGYALGIAALFVSSIMQLSNSHFHAYLNVFTEHLQTYWQQFALTNNFKEKLLLALLVSYGLFLHILSHILPW